MLYSIVNENMPETMPDIGTLIAVAPVTYALATPPGRSPPPPRC